MNDRELIELAAKAAGRSIWWSGPVAVLHDFDAAAGDKCSSWYPLTDDGDALRLAVKLRLAITVSHHNETHVEGPPPAEAYAFEKHGDDPCAATRRAIVRTAAAIGASNET